MKDSHIPSFLPSEESPLLRSNSKSLVTCSINGDEEEAEDTEIKVLTYFKSVKQVSFFATPFVLSRLAVAINVIGNGIVLAKLSPTAAASGPLIISTVYAVIGPARATLLSTGILIGKVDGAATECLKNNDFIANESERRKIGDILRKSLLFGVILAIPSCGIMLSTEYILEAIGVSHAIAEQVQGFLTSTTIGLLPMYWSTSDQQFALGIKRKNVPLYVGALFSGLSMLLGYPLAFGVFGLPKLGTAGLGYGMSAASWISFLSLRIYLLKAEFNSYYLFKLQFRGIFNQFSELVRLGLPMGFQAITEWVNLAILSSMMGRLGKDPSIAALVSVQIISAFTLGISALGQATSVLISTKLGEMDVAKKLNKFEEMKIHNSNIKRIGNGGIITGILTSIVVGSLLVSIPKEIASLFIDSNDAENEEVLVLAQAMLIINGAGLLFDSIRNVSASALGGSKDVIFAPFLSLITMSVIGLSVGGGLSLLLDWGADWLFITRDIGILLAAVGIVFRWLRKDYLPAEQQEAQNQQKGILNSFCCFFGKNKKNPKTLTIQPSVIEEIESPEVTANGQMTSFEFNINK